MNVFILLNLCTCLFVLQCFVVSSGATCTKGEVDVLFIIDSSSNIGADNFNLELRVAANLAENFHIGPDAVQFGAITFGDNFNNLFDFNSYVNFIDIEKALVNAQYLSGSANTSVVLENGRNFFSGGHGSRNTAARVALVFTNGRSIDSVRTQQQAVLLKSVGVYVIAVGLPNSNSQELLAIASEPKAVVQISDFKEVLHVLQDTINNTCTQATCTKGHVDFLFIIDSSSNVGSDNFNLELRVAANLAENFHIGPDAVQFGAITFADNFNNLFDFNSYVNFIDIEKALVDAQYLSGNTNTSLALENGRNFFTDNHGARSTSTRVAIMFTSGRSIDSVRTQQQADLLKHDGVYVIVVGLPNSNNQELQAIASEPRAVLQINDFSEILQALQGIINNSCAHAPCTKGQLDVMYILDSSSTVGAANFDHGLGLAANLAENFHIGTDDLQFAALAFANNAITLFNFTTFTDYIDLEKAILDVSYQTGNANTSLALEVAGRLFDGSHGDRIGAPNVAVVITNGMSSDPAKTAQEASLLKQLGVYVIAVGYAGANRQELESIASQSSLVFDVSNFNGILKAIQDYSRDACSQNIR